MSEYTNTGNTTENLVGRTGGPYLDIEEAKARELKSARIEDREPDFSAENLFPMHERIIIIEVDVTDDESVNAAYDKLNSYTSEKGTQVTASSSDEAPLSSPVLAVEASTEEPTPSGQVKTEEGVSNSAAVYEEVQNTDELDPQGVANNSDYTTPDTTVNSEVAVETPTSPVDTPADNSIDTHTFPEIPEIPVVETIPETPEAPSTTPSDSPIYDSTVADVVTSSTPDLNNSAPAETDGNTSTNAAAE